jgi:hypothetical protein
VKLDLGTHKGNASSFSLKTGCDMFELAPSASTANSSAPNLKLRPAQAAVMGLAMHSMPPRGPVHLIEEKVFAQFSDEGKNEG